MPQKVMASIDQEVAPRQPVTDWSSMDPLYRWDTHFPERITKLNLSVDSPKAATRRRRGRANRDAARYKTQPITLNEIKEVDEESPEDKKEGLKNQFTAFSRSMDGLLPNIKKFQTGKCTVTAPETKTEKTPADKVGDTTDEPKSSCETQSQSKPQGLAGFQQFHENFHPRRKKKHAKKSAGTDESVR